jgi:hypothetical protein
MKKLNAILLFLFLALPIRAQAQAVLTPTLSLEESLASESAEATPEAKPTVVEEVAERITEPQSPKVKSKLEAVLRSQELKGLSPTNFLKHSIRKAVDVGVSPNTIVLILLLPLIGALVGVLQYFVGLSGFGMFIPAMLAVTFLATGIGGGLFMFGIIVLVGNLAKKLLTRIRLHYWPKRAIILVFTSLATFGVLWAAPYLGIVELSQVSIFPILFFILLSEEFSRTQTDISRRKAISLTAATIVLAIMGTILMSWESLQSQVLLNPELSIVLVIFFNIVIGRYSGFRLLEYRRFYSVIKKH